MNKAILVGRLTRDPDVRWTQGPDQKCTARYTLAVDRRVKPQEGQQSADFISCVVFGKGAEFAEKYLRKGMKIGVVGRITTGSYTNREGAKVYTTDVVVDEQEFVESKGEGESRGSSQGESQRQQAGKPDADGFMDIPDGIEEGLPFV